jgi:hypothetical protein
MFHVLLLINLDYLADTRFNPKKLGDTKLIDG